MLNTQYLGNEGYLLMGCPELFDIRNSANPKSLNIPLMNAALRKIGCSTSSSTRGTPVAASQSEALRTMEIAFEGRHSKAQIKRKLDIALQLYSLPITEENYSRAGSTLVALSNEYGPTEMDILDHMIRSHVPGVNITFPNAAGLSVAFLPVGDR